MQALISKMDDTLTSCGSILSTPFTSSRTDDVLSPSDKFAFNLSCVISLY